DGEEGRAEDVLLARGLCRRDEGAQQGRDPRRQAPGAGDRKGGGAHGAARPARPPGHAQSQGLSRAGASAWRAEPGAARYRRDEPQECEGLSMADENTPENDEPEKEQAEKEQPEAEQKPAPRRTGQRRSARAAPEQTPPEPEQH